MVFGILDQYKRRGPKQERIIGTLLGERKGSDVYISNCFRVPHVEHDGTVRRARNLVALPRLRLNRLLFRRLRSSLTMTTTTTCLSCTAA